MEQKRMPSSLEITHEEVPDGMTMEDYYKNPLGKEQTEKRDARFTKFLPLWRASLNDDWDFVKRFINQIPDAFEGPVTENHDTVLHLMATSTKALPLLKELLDSVSDELMRYTDINGQTSLFGAAKVGNTEAAKLLLDRCHDLLFIQFQDYYYFPWFPIHFAALFGHKDTVNFLMEKHLSYDISSKSDDHMNCFIGESGVSLLNYLITTDLYGIALDVLERFPLLAFGEDFEKKTAFETLALKPFAFPSGSQFSWWKNLIYKWIPVQPESTPAYHIFKGISDTNNPIQSSGYYKSEKFISFGKRLQELCDTAFYVIRILGKNSDAMSHQQFLDANELLNKLCERPPSNSEVAERFLKKPLFEAIILGIHEFVSQIIEHYPPSLGFFTEEGHNIFLLSILYRQEKIFEMIINQSYYCAFLRFKDGSNNNILHLAAKLVPSPRVTGAALQMQREIQWFKAVEQVVHRSLQEERNVEGKTPRELFGEQHKELTEKGETWMKNFAQSCSVVAGFIMTVVFAGAITFPGGNDSDNSDDTKGLPLLLDHPAFQIFLVTDTLALVTSITSILLFLRMLTSRCSAGDFLKPLPDRLLSGVIMLMLSLTFMMVAFGAGVHIGLHRQFRDVDLFFGLVASIPIVLFAVLQGPLLFEIFHATYQPTVLQKVKVQRGSYKHKSILDVMGVKKFWCVQ